MLVSSSSVVCSGSLSAQIPELIYALFLHRKETFLDRSQTVATPPLTKRPRTLFPSWSSLHSRRLRLFGDEEVFPFIYVEARAQRNYLSRDKYSPFHFPSNLGKAMIIFDHPFFFLDGQLEKEVIALFFFDLTLSA